MPALIGTSGWHYSSWRGCVYPPGLPPSRWLGHYAGLFATVELNNAFYRLPEASVFEGWAQALPDDFVVAVKASRYLTHIKRLHDPAEPAARLIERARFLGPKLGPILLQLPPNLGIDVDALTDTMAAFPAEVRLAVEFRHPSWFDPAVRRALTERGAALCLVDRRGPVAPLWRTADWGYVRFHAGRGWIPGCYGPTALSAWARRVADLWPASAEVFAFFNNDAHACAPRDARRFAGALSRRGWSTSRVPAPGQVRLAAL